ncbi:hypothetical protein N7468_009653 [Penicillium chermesinum]|uniref:Uncharacterized protein n=1 Tax=Penicillium chermesinum TaxID=63820 RepID=A0A9W9NKN1_9EURO|nr:uncharacterized protein N7468_009653 [Penicillium chermesinum]KAJ5220449.1 hypothetical protein N7468_009653 [Penicillium chermesinum]
MVKNILLELLTSRRVFYRLIQFLEEEDLAYRLECRDLAVRLALSVFATTPSILLIDSAVVHRSARAHEEAHPHPDVQDPTFCRDILATSNRWCRHGWPAARQSKSHLFTSRAILPLCHAATDVPSFFHALSLMGGLSHPKVVFGGQLSGHRYRRNVVDYALISLRIAVEQGQSTATAQHVPLTGSRRGSIIPVTNSIIWCFAHLEKEMAADSTPHDSYR